MLILFLALFILLSLMSSEVVFVSGWDLWNGEVWRELKGYCSFGMGQKLSLAPVYKNNSYFL